VRRGERGRTRDEAVRARLSRHKYEAAPYEAWNAFVDLVIGSEYEELTALQRAAHLAIWYDSEVENGGHLQYFENRGTSRLQETLAALDILGAHCQREVLEEAARVRLTKEREPIRSVNEYVARALEGEYSALDSRYYECRPRLSPDLLEAYLQANVDEFIEWI
jgi:hypothetical protein